MFSQACNSEASAGAGLLQKQRFESGIECLANIFQEHWTACAQCSLQVPQVGCMAHAQHAQTRARLHRSQPCSGLALQQHMTACLMPQLQHGVQPSTLYLSCKLVVFRASCSARLWVNAKRPAPPMHGNDGAVHGHIVMRQAHGMPLSHLRVELSYCRPFAFRPLQLCRRCHKCKQ